MKTLPTLSKSILFGLTFIGFSIAANAQGPNWNQNADRHEYSKNETDALVQEALDAKAEIIDANPEIQLYFAISDSYVVFPKNDAEGKGILFENGIAVGITEHNRGSKKIAGSNEVIFFETDEATENFQNDQLQLSNTAAAVVLNENKKFTPEYTNGVMVVAEANKSVSGQSFNFESTLGAR